MDVCCWVACQALSPCALPAAPAASASSPWASWPSLLVSAEATGGAEKGQGGIYVILDHFDECVHMLSYAV